MKQSKQIPVMFENISKCGLLKNSFITNLIIL